MSDSARERDGDQSVPPSLRLSSMQKAILALDRMKEKIETLERRSSEPIAVIGMACRFPGGSTTPEAFFRFLLAGRDAVTNVPADRWPLPTTDQDPALQGGRWGAFLTGVDQFDPSFFGISPREAERLDPQQRLLLEVVWEALERAGQVPQELVGSKTGVFVGVMTTDYMLLQFSTPPDAWDAYTATGTGHCFPAGRIAYTFGFQGPTMVVDTACSSSLVATHLGCQSLRCGESDLVVVGGVNLMLSPEVSEVTSRTRALAPDGRCKTFDARADGYVRGEGCGVLLLKRLSDAQRSRDPILALIRGAAVNQDGRSTGLTTPNVLSQQAMLEQALANAQVTPEDIGYVETHGTGTSLGDPIEIEALRAVLGKPRPDGSRCVLGAVKTNIGHLEAAAGVAGMIKATMVFREETIPKNLHFGALNPRISIEDTPFVIPTQRLPWGRGGQRRFAGVSSFGLSGTNAHVVLEEPPLEGGGGAALASAYLIPLSAKSPDALRALARSYADLLADPGGATLADIAYTAGVRRGHHEHRLAVVGSKRAEVGAALAAFVHDGAARGIAPGRAHSAGRPRLVLVFPGQGSQWLGMGRQLLAEEAVFRETMELCSEAIQRFEGFSVIHEIEAGEDRSSLADINVVQPVLFAVQVSLAALWRSWGVEPDAVVGHSMGEVAAARVAGILSLEDAARIICRRSRLLRRIAGQGAMALVELPVPEAEEAIARLRDRLSVAVSNGPRSTVISGEQAALDEVVAALDVRGVFCRRVKVDVASHSPQVDSLRDDLLAALRSVRPRPARLPMRSTVTGELARGHELDAGYWMKNLREPVRFMTATHRLLDDGYTLFVEVSPHPVLLPSVEESLHDRGIDGAVIASMHRGADERRSMLEALGALYARGYPVSFGRLYPSGGRCVELPTYPWQRVRCWPQDLSPSLRRHDAPAPAEAGVPDGWLWEPQWRGAPRPVARGVPRGSWLVLVDRAGVGDTLVRRLRGAGAVGVRVAAGGATRRVEPGSWEIDPADPAAYERVVHDAFAAGAPPRGVVHLFAVDAPGAPRTTVDALASAQILGSESVLLLAKALLRAQLREVPPLRLVTRGAVTVGSERGTCVAHAPVWGFARTLQAESPELGCKLVDVPPGDAAADEAVLDALWAEIMADDAEDQIALRGEDRFVARLAPYSLDGGASRAARLRADASYLITGGLGGLGLALSEWMVARGARHLVLAARSAPSEAAREVIARMEKLGASVHVEAVDVARVADVEGLFARIRADLPPLRGVVHAAGVLRDRTVSDLSVAEMREVAASKVQGAWNLHVATLDLALDLFVLYASAASLMGSPGQANYAAANAFLDALAGERRARGLPALAVDWGPFSETGLAAARVDRGERLGAIGLRSITPAEGHAVLASLWSSHAVQVGVMSVDAGRLATVMPRLRTTPYFAELMRTAGSADGPAAPEDALGKEIRTARPGARPALLVRLVRDTLARVMRMAPALVAPSEPFHAYGFDSLMGLELRNRLQAALGIKLTMADILTHAQVDALAATLGERISCDAASAPAEPAPATLREAGRSGGWVVIPRPVPSARMRLFCFPYAGGAAPVYASWPSGLPFEIELCAIQPPGRHERLLEPLPQSVEEMVDELVPALLPVLDRPFATFGHCLGAVVMFEVLQALAQKHGLRPVQVFVSGAPSPRRYLVPSLATRTPADIRELLRAIGFASDGVLEDEDAERHMLPAVRADFEVAARYKHASSPLLDVPISAFAGRDDTFAPPAAVEDWRAFTASRFTKTIFPGEHYFIVPERDRILRIIGEEARFCLAALDAGKSAQLVVRALDPGAAPRSRLFCFPGVGRSSSMYASWVSALAPDIEVCTIELPGHGRRARELPLGRMDELVDHVALGLYPYLDKPYAFAGLDLGALVMFEVTRRLREERRPQPRHMLIGGSMAPQLHHAAPVVHLTRERLLGMHRFHGIPLQESDEAELALRADCAALASYVFREGPLLDTPFTVFLGERDTFVPAGGVQAWDAQTSASFKLHACPCAHDLFDDKPADVLDFVRRTLDESRV